MKRSNLKKYIRISEICFAVSASSFLIIPKADFNGGRLQQIMAYMVGALFWLGLTAGLISIIILNNKRRKAKFKKYRIPGIISFFKNKNAKICDTAMIVSTAALIIADNMLGFFHTLSLVLLSVTVFTIYLHSVLNGNNYAYAYQKGVRK